jgi:hypothetical protein
MVEKELFELVRDTCLYFRKPETSLKSTQLWYEEVRFIPSEAVPWISKSLREGKFPDHFPRAIKKLWSVWLADNPEKRARKEKGCIECDQGFLLGLKDGHSFVFRCVNCRTIYEPGIPVARRKDLIQAGYALVWTHKTTREIKELPEYKRGLRLLEKELASNEDLDSVVADLVKKVEPSFLDRPFNGQF